MLVPFFIAAIATIPAVTAQDVTSSATRCETRFGMFPAPTGSSLLTWYNYATTTNTFQITTTTQETITLTPSATTFTDVVNVTSTFSTTVSSTPVATTVPTDSGFFPLLITQPTPSAIARIKRGMVQSRIEHNLHRIKRQTPPGNTGGFIALSDGSTSNLNRIYPHRVDCSVTVSINSTVVTVVSGLPNTEVLVPATATAVSTATFSVTQTVTEVAPRPTVYAACQANNVVSQVLGFSNEPIYFDRVVFRPNEGFPIANSLVLNTTDATNCCIACQKQAFCAGSFFAPSRQACHLQLTEAAPAPAPPALPAPSSSLPIPSSNSSLPYATAIGAPYPIPGNATADAFATASGMLGSGVPTLLPTASANSSSEGGGMSILPIFEPASTGTFANPGSGTCSIGSLGLYLGIIRGQTDFPPDVAVSFSNGPCGRLSIDFEPVTPENEDIVVRKRMVAIS